jgi:hypothetical protein
MIFTMNINSSSRPLCEGCVHFNRQAHIHEQEKGYGRCHRYPPSFTESSSGDKIHQWQFPLVSIHSWCSEHALEDTTVKAEVKNQ